jgi:hypothetical protein
VTINQCNGSANGGGGRVVCSATMTTVVIDTPAGTPTTASGAGTPTTAPDSGTPVTIPAQGTPVGPEGSGGQPTAPDSGASSVPAPIVTGATTTG